MKPIPLTPRVLEFAYRQGYFPMCDPDTGETNWYCPEPRAILPLDAFHCSRTLAKRLKTAPWTLRFNTAFSEVMRHCADRPEGSWISEEFIDAYTALHRDAKAHSVEIWDGEKLVGGVYGVALGGAFFAESMFHRSTDASKAALYYLVRRLNECGYALLETQFLTPHLESLGAIEIEEADYNARLAAALALQPSPFAPADAGAQR